MGEKSDRTDEPSVTEEKASAQVVTTPAGAKTIMQALASQPGWLW